MFLSRPERQILFEKGSAPVLGLVGELINTILCEILSKVGEEDEDLRELAKFSFQRAAQNGRADCKLVTMQWKFFLNLPLFIDCWCFPSFSPLSFRLSLRARAT